MKKTMGVTEDDPQKELKDELKHLFAKLCGKLNALCNFHYTPKGAMPEMKVGYDNVITRQALVCWRSVLVRVKYGVFPQHGGVHVITLTLAREWVGVVYFDGWLSGGSASAVLIICTNAFD